MDVKLNKMTDATAAKLVLPANKNDIFVPDPELRGHGVRVRRLASGTAEKTWGTLPKRLPNGKQRRGHFGTVGAVLIKDARRACQIFLGQLACGEDPAAAKEEAKAQRHTLESVIPRYVSTKKESSRQPIEHYLNNVWARLHSKPLSAITLRDDVAPSLEEFVTTRGRPSARAARVALNGLYVWANHVGLVPHSYNPVRGTRDPAKDVMPRERVLDDVELAAIWHACEEDVPGRLIRLLILTPLRRDELGDLKQSEVDFATGTLTIDGKRVKNGRTLIVKLAPSAAAILRSLPRYPDREHVFGSRPGSKAGFSGWGAAKLRLDNRITMMTGRPLPRWTIHDLRRTTRTRMSQLKIPPHVAELALGHYSRKSLQATYDKYLFEPEVAAALRVWDRRVAAIIKQHPPVRVSVAA